MSTGNHIRTVSLAKPKISILDVSLQSLNLRSRSYLPGANNLKYLGKSLKCRSDCLSGIDLVFSSANATTLLQLWAHWKINFHISTMHKTSRVTPNHETMLIASIVSHEDNITECAQDSIPWNEFENYTLNINAPHPMDLWVKLE